MWQRHLTFQFTFFLQCHGRKFALDNVLLFFFFDGDTITELYCMNTTFVPCAL